VVSSVFVDEKKEDSTEDVSIVVVVVEGVVSISATDEDIAVLVEVDGNDEYSIECEISSVIFFVFTLVVLEILSCILEIN
jgi:hypothetical protein